MTIYIPVKKTGESIPVELTQFNNLDPTDAAELQRLLDKSSGLFYCLFYGMKQTSNDGHANQTTKSGAKAQTVMEKTQAKLAKAIAGLVRAGGGGGRSPIADPVLRRALIVASAQFVKFTKENVGQVNALRGMLRGESDEYTDLNDDDVDEILIERLAHDSEIWAAAVAFVEAAKAKPAIAGKLAGLIKAADMPATTTTKKGKK